MSVNDKNKTIGTFLSCDGFVYPVAKLVLKYQGKQGLTTQEVWVDGRKEYKISVVDNEMGLTTYDCRITGFSLSRKHLSMFINFGNNGDPEEPYTLDTIHIDYSENGHSQWKSINISDIRMIEEFNTEGFEDITDSTIETFR